MNNWKELPLNDVIELVIDHRGKTPKKLGFDDFFSEGYPVLSAKHVKTSGLVNLDAMRFANEEMYKKWMKEPTQKGDVILTSEAPLGELFYIDGSKKYVLGQRVFGLRPKSDVLDSMYLLVWLSSAEGQGRLQARATGSTVQGIKQSELLKIMIPIPPMEVQKDIASIYGSLDQKIQLNTQINQTLEQIAQALFKSWFVDFDPVRAKVQALSDGLSLEQAELAAMQAISGKTAEELTALSQTQPDRYAELAETTKAFPCEMVEIDGVEVPKGWEVKPIELILDRLKNKQKLRKEEISFEGTIPVFEQGASILMGYHDKDAAFNASIDEPIFIFGDHTCITKLSTIPFSIYQNVIPLIGKNLPTYWVYCAIQNKQTFQEYRRHWAELIVKEVVVPDNINLCQYFSKKVKELFFKIDINHQENRTLIETRDLLLPRLLNGEI